ncbi:MAG: hypothetical protein KA714_13115 [Limnoraphis sp. WC205]|jgi:hypothetical protein|nr:hypothetical protein [Limnoraphis sp. WC205]
MIARLATRSQDTSEKILPQCRREASRYNRGGFIEAQTSTANGLAVR